MDQGLKQGAGKTKPDEILTPAQQARLKVKAADESGLTVSFTKERLGEILSKAKAEQLSVSEFAKQIDDYFKLNSRTRSLRIARTEMTDSINDGVLKTLDAEGHAEKEWSTVIDGNERESHADADGQTVGMDQTFNVGGASCMYPGDPMLPPEERINCRCTVLGARLPDDRRRQMGSLFLRTHSRIENQLVIHLRREFDRQRRRTLSHFPT